MLQKLRVFVDCESGQGITEYGALIAFIAVLVTTTAAFVSGGLTNAISSACSVIVSTMDLLNSQVTSS